MTNNIAYEEVGVADVDRDKLIDILSEELPVLRAKIGLSQEELSDIIGVSRQTYSSIETKKRRMTWGTFLSLILFFDNNEKTSPMLQNIGAFPDSLKNLLNKSNRD
ncbi:helix-turn-helix transcriptional regulator [Butyrivibrio sp. VCB2001]|uniref:helix-turn-helix transcriptional regulator n=1 Tax=Butyrivibrio sp. VCB2001 TaxID=1280667 RepID=UPI000687EF1B|nr:helix-turn-helix transcriptional regulator [Butyrivibrio sp. VCB2001]